MDEYYICQITWRLVGNEGVTREVHVEVEGCEQSDSEQPTE